MRPTLVTPDIIDGYLEAGHWTRETMLDRYDAHAADHPDEIACRDGSETHSWAELDAVTDRLAANLVDLGLDRDATAMVLMPSACKEVVLRVGFKKAGIIGAFAPMQWRRKELEYLLKRIRPGLIVMSPHLADPDVIAWLDDAIANSSEGVHRLDMANDSSEGWLGWHDLLERAASSGARGSLAHRRFAFDEISLISASSGTSGLAKLCEWPEGAQVCMSRVLCERIGIAEGDTVGVFAPMSGAAGLMGWMITWAVRTTCVFPDNFRAPALLDLVQASGITVGTTVPVILARLAQEPLENHDLSSLRLMRVGTAAANTAAALSFESRTGCRVVVAAGAMECTGFGHANVNEPMHVRLDGSVGLPLRGCRIRIEDERGDALPAGTAGELKVTAPFSSSGYWDDPEATAEVWREGWYSTGDIGVVDDAGRLTLLGRLKDVINRSGHKIMAAEVEQEISRHPDIFECAVVAAPDGEYGEVPWAFVQMRAGSTLDAPTLIEVLRKNGLATYKFPARFIDVAEFPRISDNKIDKNALLKMSPAVIAAGGGG
jgi:non-ribosomal peptide synthetase component E (peptide arylation enzyme)